MGGYNNGVTYWCRAGSERGCCETVFTQCFWDTYFLQLLLLIVKKNKTINVCMLFKLCVLSRSALFMGMICYTVITQ